MTSVSILDTLSFTVLSVIFIPFLLFFLGIVLFAYIGKTLGIQRIYVEFLVKVFEVSTYHLRYCYKLIIHHIIRIPTYVGTYMIIGIFRSFLDIYIFFYIKV